MQKTGTPHWFSELERVILNCQSNIPTPLDQIIKQTYTLIESAPSIAKPAFVSSVPLQRLERLITCEAYESAAVSLLGGIPFMVSRSSTGWSVATVCLPGEDETSFEAEELSTALCGALCLAALRAYSPPDWLADKTAS